MPAPGPSRRKTTEEEGPPQPDRISRLLRQSLGQEGGPPPAPGTLPLFGQPREEAPLPHPSATREPRRLPSELLPVERETGDVSLPGLAPVRMEERILPEVAPVPRPAFDLTPPPEKPAAPPTQGDLFARSSLRTRLLSERGVLIFEVPAGDRTGIRKWLQTQEKEHGGEAWYARMEQAVDDGNWDAAWKIAASQSVRSYAKAQAAAQTPQEAAQLAAAVRGTPLQEDLNAQIIAQARRRAHVGEAPPTKGMPPSVRVTQAGAARGKATVGPAGVLSPGARQRPLSSAAPALRAATLDRSVVRLIVEGIETPEGLATVPGNTDTYLRLFRQVGEQIYKGQNLKLLREAGVSIPPEELAQHWNATISDAGRTLQTLSAFAQAHADVLTEAANRMSMGGALRGMLGEGGPPPKYVGARGRVLSPGGQQAAQEVVDQIAERSSRYQASALANDMQKRRPVSGLRAIHDASYAWMLSKWNTAVRNYVSFTGRYGVDSLDHALTIPIARLTGDEPTAVLSSALLQERGLQPIGRPGTAVTPKRAWSDELQGIYDFTIDNLNTLKLTDVRRSIRLLLDFPERGAEYLGTMTGEDLSSVFSDKPVLRHLLNPKVQRVLTMFNRAGDRVRCDDPGPDPCEGAGSY